MNKCNRIYIYIYNKYDGPTNAQIKSSANKKLRMQVVNNSCNGPQKRASLDRKREKMKVLYINMMMIPINVYLYYGMKISSSNYVNTHKTMFVLLF